MELLRSLEEKILSLLELIQNLKDENCKLKQDVLSKEQLLEQAYEKVAQLEGSLLQESGRLQEQLQREKELTKTVVDDLIKNIDAIIVESESHQ